MTVPGKSGGSTITDPSIKNRLLSAATELFGEKGFAGTSVRDICARADASVPMINHHFGNKEGLYRTVLDQLSADAFDVPLRLIEGDLKSREEFLTKLELFISETFNALLSLASVFRIINREGGEFADLQRVHTALGAFLVQAQAKGFVRESLHTDLTTGLILDRLGNQILFSVSATYKGPDIRQNASYRKEWLAANIDALLHGFAGQ